MILFEQEQWALMKDTSLSAFGWKSVLKHTCDVDGAPYWMLLERASDPERCWYCKEAMPKEIVTLFKLMNWNMIKGA